MLNVLNYIKNRYYEDKRLFLVLGIYSLICLISGIYCFVIANIKNGLMSILFIIHAILILIGEKVFKIKIGAFLSAIILLIAIGGLFGTCYELYIRVPIFDSVLHCLSGYAFAYLGFLLFRCLIGNIDSKGKFWAAILAGISFSLAVAVLWEMFEYTTTFFGFDMLEDTIVTGFDSYLLAGSHSEVVSINGITQTIINYANGESIVIDGYLDIGLIDTLHDMIICVVGSIIFLLTFKINPQINAYFYKKRA